MKQHFLINLNLNNMNTQQFLEHIKKTFDNCLNIVELKNSDYAGSQDYPFKNFENSLLIGVSPERGILVRITDKLSRISNLLNSEAKVKDEKIEDTINDAINYLAILKAYLNK
jgi:hypothetical protein